MESHPADEAGFIRALAAAPEPPLSDADLEGLPDPVVSYFRSSLTAGAPLALAVRLRMRGRIKVGRWLPFTAEQVLSPRRGFLWSARAAGSLIRGFDSYLHSRGVMQWKLLGLFTVMAADGPDTAKTAAGRAGGESVWVPAAVLPRYGAKWTSDGPRSAVARFSVDETPLEIHYRFDDAGRIASCTFDRWGDPDGTGTPGWHPAGGDMVAHRTFGSLTIPSAGSFGWHHGTDRWPEGEFFRYEITALEPL